jgi:hypothetical protein
LCFSNDLFLLEKQPLFVSGINPRKSVQISVPNKTGVKRV